jgi:HD-GYP domain-containing protein (c-di-GMP phosphodiesterase class II)
MSKPVLDACLHHHEKMDGTGYPDKLQGDQIS